MAKLILSCLLVVIVLVGAFRHADATELEAAESTFAAWPETWKDTYRHFETYIEGRSKGWPTGSLSISPDGVLAHSVHFAQTSDQHLTIRFFSKGRDFLSMADSSDLFGKGRAPLFPPGDYSVALLVHGSFGYQYLYPVTSFRVREQERNVQPEHENEAAVRKIVQILEPVRTETAWPNERLMLFLDFHIFPMGGKFNGPLNPSDVISENLRVSPSVKLALSQSGALTRNLLPEPVEKCLRWRIYRDGALVEQTSAEGAEQYEIKAGMGSYVLCIGVYGPTGFMPVSNVLNFPLFKDAEAGMRVVPRDADNDGVPDTLQKFVTGPAKPVPFDTDVDGDGVPNSEEDADGDLSDLDPRAGNVEFAAPGNEEMTRYIELWESWRHELSYRRVAPEKFLDPCVFKQK